MKTKPAKIDLEQIINDIDEEWLSAIAQNWKRLTGNPWDTYDGETRSEGLVANVGQLFACLEARQQRIDELIAQIPKPIPAAKFKVGDPVKSNLGEYADFISDAIWVEKLNTWRYGINYSQDNMCSLTHWQGGGSGFWTSESELKQLTGVAKLKGELWRELRIQQELKFKLNASKQNADKLRYAIGLIATPDPEQAKI